MESLHLGVKAISEQIPNKHVGAAQMLILGGGCAHQLRDCVTIDNLGLGDAASPLPRRGNLSPPPLQRSAQG